MDPEHPVIASRSWICASSPSRNRAPHTGTCSPSPARRETAGSRRSSAPTTCSPSAAPAFPDRRSPSSTSARSPPRSRTSGSARWWPRRRSATHRCWRSPQRTWTTSRTRRLELGIGSGWNESEHRAYGLDFGSSFGDRFDRLTEQLEIITGLWATPLGGSIRLRGQALSARRRTGPAQARAAQRGRRVQGADHRRWPRAAPDARARGPIRRRVQRRVLAARRGAARSSSACGGVRGRRARPRLARLLVRARHLRRRRRGRLRPPGRDIGRDPEDLRRSSPLAGTIAEVHRHARRVVGRRAARVPADLEPAGPRAHRPHRRARYCPPCATSETTRALTGDVRRDLLGGALPLRAGDMERAAEPGAG